MNDFLAARSQMALSLGFHIVFSCIGMVMPFFMAVSHFYWLKTGRTLSTKMLLRPGVKALPFSLQQELFRNGVII